MLELILVEQEIAGHCCLLESLVDHTVVCLQIDEAGCTPYFEQQQTECKSLNVSWSYRVHARHQWNLLLPHMPYFVEHVVVRYLVVEILPRIRVSFVELKPSRESCKLVLSIR